MSPFPPPTLSGARWHLPLPRPSPSSATPHSIPDVGMENGDYGQDKMLDRGAGGIVWATWASWTIDWLNWLVVERGMSSPDLVCCVTAAQITIS